MRCYETEILVKKGTTENNLKMISISVHQYKISCKVFIGENNLSCLPLCVHSLETKKKLE